MRLLKIVNKIILKICKVFWSLSLPAIIVFFCVYFSSEDNSGDIANLLDEDFNASWTNQVQESSSEINSSSELAGLSWPTNTDLLTGEFMPSKLLQEGLNFLEHDLSSQTDNKDKSKSPVSKQNEKQTSKDSNSTSQVSWLSLFAELDPLANQTVSQSTAADRA